MTVLLLILGILLIEALVVLHEFGHYIAAKRNGIVAEEFAIGFPPKIWSRKMKNGTVFCLNMLPLGGYVKLKGENDSAKGKGSFGEAPLKAKVKVMSAGVGMNLLVAFVLLTALALMGMPKIIDNQFSLKSDAKTIKDQVLIGDIEAGSPAEKAGLKKQDQIISFQGVDKGKVYCLALNCSSTATINITNKSQLPATTKGFANQNAQLQYKRGSEIKTAEIKLRSESEVTTYNKEHHCTDKHYQDSERSCKGYLGITPLQYTVQRSTWSAPIVAIGVMKQITFETFKGLGTALGNLFKGNTKKASAQVAGPVGIFVLLKDGSLLGIQVILFIVAIISLALAIMNVLPIPALDGGRLFVTLFFHSIKKPLTKRAENLIHGTGFALLMLLFIAITIVDIGRL